MNKYLPLVLVITLFFLWAFVHNLEPILIPHLKKACRLTDLQSALIDSAVYVAYFLLALPAGWFIKKYGYKKGILFGLFLYASGALLFIPAADARAFSLFLGALFIIAAGCTFLETAANPYVTILGPSETAATRLNFAQSFNGLGAAIAPYLGGVFILSGIEFSDVELSQMSSLEMNQYLTSEANAVKIPYFVIAMVVIVVAIIIIIVKMPEALAIKKGSPNSIMNALKHRQLKWGILAQFFCVGAQVCITSFFIRLAKYAGDVPEKRAAALLGLAMLGFMIGRFTGTFLTRYIPANRLLFIYSLVCSGLLIAALALKSELTMWLVLVVPFFQSIMFPTIFVLSINRIKEHTEIGSALVVMSIVGGAIFPLIMGFISDRSNIQTAYIVPLLCFLVIAWYGLNGFKQRKRPTFVQTDASTN